MQKIKNLYKVLEISEQASEEEIKAAYRKQAKKYHPDAHPGDLECEKHFQAVNEAYSILGNTDKRREYDCHRTKHKGAEGKEQKRTKAGYSSGENQEVDFENIHKTFERFFGVNPNTGNVANEKSRNPKVENSKGENVLDTTDLFQRFMGIKR